MHALEGEPVERVVGDATCARHVARAPIRCDLGVSLFPRKRAQHQAKETIDPLAPVTDRSSRRIESGSISTPSPSGRRGIPQHSPARFHPRSSILLVWMVVPTITSGIRLLLRLCRRAGGRLNDARLGVSADAGQHCFAGQGRAMRRATR
jgi:hypothetical protein